MTKLQRVWLYGAWQCWVLDQARRHGTPSWPTYLARLGYLPRIPENEA